ncbi:cleavage polyadenylation factor subunit RNA14 ASCRUDRAFT_43913 [Ascoidea rubescens DSM 1968]|uniref:mRNA 3'-end-processing protein RNA14 n=1 Tax=Ascoidea rubescens DSM 1968 TaxID=1344418 RepID=A0A1D2VL14_9ASCO|nr:hypothetical protein ASCRUDRAFT_43913 [Ascoidea rubescens DSM 1968]ODV62288.1 hypothetical protein ASCRUDRAFT_43913 [Ascoidea rubescens DSM 1968]
MFQPTQNVAGGQRLMNFTFQATTPQSISLTPLPEKNVPVDLVDQLEDKLKENTTDFNTWLLLIYLTQKKDKLVDVRKVYENCLKVFPFSSLVWLNYINYELSRAKFEEAESLFSRCLNKNLSVSLWQNYIEYVLRTNTNSTKMINEKQIDPSVSRGIVIQAFDFALDNIGIDINSTPLWESYLDYINNWKTTTNWENQQKMDIKRRIFNKCCKIPLNNLSRLWNLYTSFENDLNPQTARNFIDHVNASYMSAKSWLLEFNNFSNGLIINDYNSMNANCYILNLNINRLNSIQQKKQLNIWKIWINFEKSNKLNLKDPKALNLRVDYIYKKTTEHFFFYPEVWFDYIQYNLSNISSSSQSQSIIKNSIKIINEAIAVNPLSFSLTYLLAELYEKSLNLKPIKKVFGTLIANYIKIFYNLESNLQLLVNTLKQINIDIKSIKENQNNLKISNSDVEIKIALLKSKYKNFTDQLINIIVKHKEIKRFITSIYIQLIKIVKRSFSKDQARSIFSEARRLFPKLTWHIYYENSMMEYYSASNTDKIKHNSKRKEEHFNFFKNENFEFILKYFEFLIMVNDYNNIRSLFESSLKNYKLNHAAVEESSIISKNGVKTIEDLGFNHSKNNSNKCCIKSDEIESNNLKKLFKILLKFELNNGNITTMKDIINKYKFEFFPNESRLKIFSNAFVEIDGKNYIKEFDIGVNSSNNEEVEDSYNFDDNFDTVYNNGNINNNKNNNSSNNNLASNGNDFSSENKDAKTFITDEIYSLLRQLPNSNCFQKELFGVEKVVELLQGLRKGPTPNRQSNWN